MCKYLPQHGYSLNLHSNPLSQTERGRLQRAFYHYQLYTCLNNSDHNGKPALQRQDQVDLFIAKFPAYQTEEHVCIYDYFEQRVQKTYEQLEDTFVDQVLADMSESGELLDDD